MCVCVATYTWSCGWLVRKANSSPWYFLLLWLLGWFWAAQERGDKGGQRWQHPLPSWPTTSSHAPQALPVSFIYHTSLGLIFKGWKSGKSIRSIIFYTRFAPDFYSRYFYGFRLFKDIKIKLRGKFSQCSFGFGSCAACAPCNPVSLSKQDHKDDGFDG